MVLKQLLIKLRGILLFGFLYLLTFFFMESRDIPVHIIHTKFDDLIPFCEYFIIPYVIWYVYVCATIFYLGLTEQNITEFNRLIITMILGMMVFVIVSFVYPNGQNLRPHILIDNIFTKAVNLLYTIDTSTNILPSLHVFVSLACDIALCRNSLFKEHQILQWTVHILTILICLSTMFLKQHSIIDVIAALICNITFYPLVYHWNYFNHRLFRKTPLKKGIG